MRTLLVALVAVCALLLGPGCALRPRYTELVPRDANEGQVLAFQLVDRKSGQPLADVPVVVGEGRERVSTRTDAQGRFALPVRRGWRSSNPVLQVIIPEGVSRYDVRPVEGMPAPSGSQARAQPQPQDLGSPLVEKVPEQQPGPDAQMGPETLRTDPTGLLSGCQVEATPNGVSVECPELMIVTAEGEAGAPAWPLAEQMVTEFSQDFQQSFGGEVAREEVALEVAGAKRRALKFGAQLPDQKVNGTVVALDPASPEAHPRAVLCLFVGEETRPCGPLLESVAQKNPEPGVYGR